MQHAIPAFGDDATTTQKDGLDSGEQFKWKIWRQSNGYTYNAVARYATTGSFGGIVSDSGAYATNGISALLSLTGSLCEVNQEAAPTAFSLSQNYPNPFNPSTTIGYAVGASSSQRSSLSGVEGSGARHVRLAVYDMLGQEVAVLVDEAKQPGYYTVQFNAARMASGIYMYRLVAGEFVAVKRLTLLR